MFDTANGLARVRAWPRKKPSKRTPEEVEREEAFRQAQWLTKIFMPDLQVECMKAVKGTPLMPRDIGTMIIYNTLCYFILPDGKRLYPIMARAEVSESVDVLEQRPNYMLWRGPEFWQGLAPGGPGQVLYTDPVSLAPQWGDLPEPPPPVGAEYTLLGEAIAPVGGIATLTVNPIAGTYRDLVINIMARCTGAAATADCRLRLNNDSGFNYDFDRVNRFGTAQGLGVTSADVGSMAGAGAVAGSVGVAEIKIPRYTAGTFQKFGVGHSYVRGVGTAAGLIAQYHGFDWRSVAAINRVDIFPSAGIWAEGSTITVYGRT